jgi:hypothetical protein
MLNYKIDIRYFIFPSLFILVILFFILQRGGNFFQANISEILGSQISEDSTKEYLLNESKNPATVILFNQFQDKDFDGILDQTDEENNRFAVVNFTKGEEIQFNGVDLEFLGILDKEDLRAEFLLDKTATIELKIDSSLITNGLSLVGRDFYKSPDLEQATVFLRTN